MPKFIDLSQVITNNMPVYPGDEEVELRRDKHHNCDGYNNYLLKTSMHVGIHIDSPHHMTTSQVTIDNYPLECFFGRGVLINAYGEKTVKYSSYYDTIVTPNSCVLIYTGHSELFGTPAYFADYPIVSEELAEFLVSRQVKLIGLDTPSPDKTPFPIHKILLQNKVFIVENLCNLDKLLGVFNFNFACFPLKITADASLVRAVAMIGD